MSRFEVREPDDLKPVVEIFKEYSQLKGAESCFVAFNNEIADLKAYYRGGALLLGYEDDVPVGSVAIRKINEEVCEAKRLYIKPECRGKGYARIMINAIVERAKKLGYKEFTFTTRPDVMKIGYELYKRMGFEETGGEDGIVHMRKIL